MRQDAPGFGADGWARPGHAHMVGICGVGMAGLAFILRRRGWRVSGCDRRLNSLAAWLREVGVEVFEGHDAAHLTHVDCLIISSAVSDDEPELRQAAQMDLPVFRRGEVLAALVSQGESVAVCGAHGKTTTSCFATRLLQELGAKPRWVIGGTTRALGSVAMCAERCGGTASERAAHETLVAEADESDGTLADYAAAITVVVNVDLDHLEHFDGEESLLACYRSAIKRTRRGVAVCADDARAMSVAAVATVPVLTFGFSESAQLRAVDACFNRGSTSFELLWQGAPQGRVSLGMAGGHNILNALGAIAAALLQGFEPQRIVAVAPAAFNELPGRRFECMAEVSGCRFVVDYAHHPRELAAAVGMARDSGADRVIVVFQPHRFTRTLALGAEFPAAFRRADEVLILPVYAASEAALEGGESCDLYAHFRSEALEGGPRVALARCPREIWEYLQRTLAPGELVLIAGAGDVVRLVDLVSAGIAQGWQPCAGDGEFGLALGGIQGLRFAPGAPLAEWSLSKVGGQAQWRVEVAEEEALAALLRLCSQYQVPWRLVGGGANSWFSDLGQSGCVIRLAAGAFDGIKVTGECVEVGGGCLGAHLLRHLEESGLAGLEHMEGIPGSVGGWLAMNAGAQGGDFGSCVEWIRCLNPEGEYVTLRGDECGFSYRSCAALQGHVALSCGLRLRQEEHAAVRERGAGYRRGRIQLAGLRTLGSVFRNPAGAAAGRLLEEAGCRGLRIGCAFVTDFHANIIAVEGAATPSDILALVLKMRGRVKRASGIELVPEICGLDLQGYGKA